MKINKNLITVAILTLTSMANLNAGKTTPKREFRSTWFTTHVNIDWPQTRGTSASVIEKQKADMVKYIEGFEKMNLNGACFQVRAQCDAVYKSSYEPWSAVLSGTRGTDPGWDPLQYCIEQCHQRGLECYAWINPFRWSNGPDYNTPQDKEFKANGWILSYDGYYVLNPAIPEARAHILKVCKEIVDNYAIDGVLFDDYFYPNNIPENSSAGDWNLYKASGTSMSIGDWRRENINLFVREFQKMIEEAHPDMRFGISPAGVAGASASKYGVDPKPKTVTASDWQYATIYSDPLAWLYEGSIDFISPQIYWQTYHSSAPYEPLCDWWSYVADHFGRHFYSSQNVYFFTNANNTTSWNEVAKEVELNRQYAEPTSQNAPGTIYYSSKYFYGPALTGLGDHLLANVNQTKALVPVVTWKKVPSFGAPENLKFDGNKLTWKAIDAPRSILRYTVYAIPSSLTVDQAMEENGDGISNDYLLKVSYSTSFDLPADKRQNYWYAVCAYDGLGNEFAPAYVNYPQGASAKVTLTSPANGSTIDWMQKFEWSKVDKAEYVLNIATDEKFSEVVLKTQRLTENSVSPDLSVLNPETKYYWNVTCYEQDKFGENSEAFSFITPKYADAKAVTLTAPDNKAEIEGDIKFRWTSNDKTDTYTLEVSKNADFSVIRYSQTTTSTELNVNPSLIGKGEYFWRVKAEGPFLNPSYSEVRSFVINSLAVGEYEPGYIVKRESFDYPTVDNVKVENMWVRAEAEPYKNISFQNNGMMERSMVAVGEYVYLTRRSENSEGASLYLEKYDGMTGEHVSSIQLGDEARVSYYPLNTVVRDDADNIIVSNLVLSAVTSPVYLHKVNLSDGSLTEIAKITLPNFDKARVDHINVSGNVETGNFNVYIAVSSEPSLVRITYVDGVKTDVKSVTYKEFYPADRANFAIAPFVTPVSLDELLVNGGGTGLALYNLATGKMTDNISNCTSAPAGATTANGSERFSLGKNVYTVYPSSDHSSGFKFGIIKGSDASFASATFVAEVPTAGLGNINSSTSSTPISAVCDSDGSARVYVYAVGNGIAAYKITDTMSSVNSLNSDDLRVTAGDKEIHFSRPVATARVYNMTGSLIAAVTNSDKCSVPASGIYIVQADGHTFRLAVR